MNFNSFTYILLFLPIACIVCQLARRYPMVKAPQICLLLASMIFYAFPKPENLLYLLGSILANWLLVRLMVKASPKRRKFYLQAALVLNIGFLCIFKYVNFFISNLPFVVQRDLQIPDLGFPLGISFFTLTQLIYLVDCYEQLMAPVSLFDHATFVTFFPYVISGPISRPHRVVQQFKALNSLEGPSADMIARSLYLFSMGLIKKVVLADAFSKATDYGFANISRLSTVEAWCFATCFGLQVYFDFGGYSDMAIASAMLVGIKLPHNFDAPLRAKSIIEFWQRWHITLTSFITTYIYTPILQSFSRVTLATSAIATMLAMTIAGLWHGPNWTFVIYGFIHGVGLAVNQYWRKTKMPRLPIALSWLLTFAVYDMAFVVFRSPDLHAAFLFFSHLFSWHHFAGFDNLRAMNGDGPGSGVMLVVFTLSQAAGVVAAFFGKSTNQLSQEFTPRLLTYAVTSACMLIALFYMNSNVVKPFVYFAF